MILMRGGMVFLPKDMMRFEKAVTTVTESAMTIAGFICTVTANAEHMPNT
jgi:hypothetical protein